EDWPQFKNDNYRSGTSVVDLNLETLDLDWTYIAPQSPVPAWYGLAKEDAFAKSGPLPSMRDYDLAYYPVIVGDNLYYSSSADDAVHCINALNGKEKWRFTTNGPVRVAPVFYKGELYFGSDDGFVYCIDADDAKLKWKFSPAPENDRLVLHNGRLISFWPIRTGVLAEDDKVYFGASLLPWKKSYFCAINSGNGSPEGEGCYVKEMDNMTFEGAMASTGKMLIQPQGRIAPAFFNKTNGEHKGSLPGTGGCFVLVTNENHIVHAQDSRNKSIQEFVSDSEPEYMSFKGGKEMVIKGDTSFILSDNSLSAYHRISKKLLWLRRSYQAHRLILSGNTLFVGATDTVYAVSPKNGLPLWKGNVDGTVYALATANNALFVSTGEGKISRFKSGGKSNLLLKQNQEKPADIDEVPVKKAKSESENKLKLKSGPFVEALSQDSVRLNFETTLPTQITLNWTASGYNSQSISLPEKTNHIIELAIKKDFIYTYKLIAEDGSS
ncbi:MAG: PQQ-binding-like beta-propeller repeat protein, partial [Cyclobacteriaceae bacterium]|nr:PQQ-binding-like beta-propeller repeat protein [Cyclobacteriaceae bacterium]